MSDNESTDDKDDADANDTITIMMMNDCNEGDAATIRERSFVYEESCADERWSRTFTTMKITMNMTMMMMHGWFVDSLIDCLKSMMMMTIMTMIVQ